MRIIWKFEVKVTDESRVRMPVGAKILPHVEAQSFDNLWIWAVVDSTQATEWVTFRVVGTGHLFPDVDALDDVGTATSGPFVWHLFHEGSKP